MIHISRHFLSLVLLLVPVVAIVRISVPHDIQPGYSIKQIHSKGRINLVENELTPHFTLLSDGSLVSTSKISELTGKPIDLLIQEELEGRTHFQPITVHIRDRGKMPSFPQREYYGYVYENEDPDSVVEIVGNLNALNGIGDVRYFLSGSPNFNVLNKDGVVRIVSTKKLDREVKEKYSLILNATDSVGGTASTTITIVVKDANDNPPIFRKSHYAWNIPHDSPLYSIVGIVKAKDADDDKPIYSFVSSNNHPFVIVPKTGEILLMGEPEPKVYSLLVQANDNRYPKLYSDIIPATVIVDDFYEADGLKESDRPLRRQKRSTRQTRTYEHFLESDGSTPGKVMFRLDSVHPDEVFNLENSSRWIDVDHNGDVKVKEPWDYEQLEREKTIDFFVQIRAPQQPEPDRQRIIIHVQDSNDENPYFINRPMPMQAVVQLNAPSGTSVFKLQARDPDSESNIHYVLVRDRTGGRFEVDEMSGEVRTVGNEPFMLDQEYVLYVKAEDLNGIKVTGREQSTGEERLSIIGGKRPPQFFMQSYSATIPENKKKDSEWVTDF